MSNLTELLPAGGGGKNVNFVASGTLASGQTVALKTDGQVEAVGETAESIGTETEFQSGRCDYTDAVYDVNANKIVIFYNLNNGGPYGVVGTVSGNSISFGTPVATGQGQIYSTLGAVYDSTNNKVLYGYRTGASAGLKVVVCTVSGTSISFGTAASIDDGNNENGGSMAYDANAQKLVVSFPDANNSQYGAAVIGTVSGTSISFGTPVVYTSSAINTSSGTSTVYDPVAQKVLIGYRDNSVARGYGIVGTVSGTSISFGTAAKYSGDNVPASMVLGYSTSASKILIVYENQNTNDGLALTATISGTSVSYGTQLTWVSNNFKLDGANKAPLNEDTNANLMVLGFNNAAYNGQVISFSISGTTVTAATSITTWDAGTQTYYIGGAYHTVEKKTIFSWGQSFSTGEAITYSPSFTNLSATTFIGISDAAISDTASGSVTIKGGISTNITGLTPNALYYVQDDGSISSPTVYIPYDITSATYADKSFSIAAQETSPRGLAINPAGTKLFVLGTSGDDVNEYALSTAFDVSSASFTQAFSISSQENNPWGITFNPTGTKMFTTGLTGVGVDEFALSSGFDVSTASFTQFLSTSTQTATPRGIAFNPTGTKMFVVDYSAASVDEYTLSSGFNVSTASYSKTFSVSANVTSPVGLAFSTDGTEMFVTMENTTYEVTRYSLSTAFDISTASYTQRLNVQSATPVDPTEDKPSAIVFNSTGTQFIILGATNDTVYQYAASLGSTSTVLAGRALSSTSINLDYTT